MNRRAALKSLLALPVAAAMPPAKPTHTFNVKAIDAEALRRARVAAWVAAYYTPNEIRTVDYEWLRPE